MNLHNITQQEDVRILVTTKAGVLEARHSGQDHRSRDREAITYYKSGEMKAVYLEGWQTITTPIGPKQAELVTFYRSGAVNRVFPSFGKISGFWSEEDERQMFPTSQIMVFDTQIEARISCYCFYEGGTIKSITLYPGERVEFLWKKKMWKARYGISFYADGKLAAFEPATTQLIELPNGNFQAFDSMAVGITGDSGSLCFYPDGSVKSLKSCTSTLYEGTKEKWIVKPEKMPSQMDPEVDIIMPVTYRFGHSYIEGTDSYGKEFYLDCKDKLKWGVC